MSSHLYENESFYVDLVWFNDPVIEQSVNGYGIWNKHTDVREAEVRRFDIARVLADAFNDRSEHVDVTEDQLSLMPAANERPV